MFHCAGLPERTVAQVVGISGRLVRLVSYRCHIIMFVYPNDSYHRNCFELTTGGANALADNGAAIVACSDRYCLAARNCRLTQFSSRPSRRKRAAVREEKPRLSRMLSGV